MSLLASAYSFVGGGSRHGPAAASLWPPCGLAEPVRPPGGPLKILLPLEREPLFRQGGHLRAPKRLQDHPETSRRPLKRHQARPKTAPRSSREAAKRCQDAAKRPQEVPKRPPRGPKRRQEAAKRPQEVPKSFPTCRKRPQEPPKRHPRSTKSIPKGFPDEAF